MSKQCEINKVGRRGKADKGGTGLLDPPDQGGDRRVGVVRGPPAPFTFRRSGPPTPWRGPLVFRGHRFSSFIVGARAEPPVARSYVARRGRAEAVTLTIGPRPVMLPGCTDA